MSQFVTSRFQNTATFWLSFILVNPLIFYKNIIFYSFLMSQFATFILLGIFSDFFSHHYSIKQLISFHKNQKD